jgi:hypothetical protein
MRYGEKAELKYAYVQICISPLKRKRDKTGLDQFQELHKMVYTHFMQYLVRTLYWTSSIAVNISANYRALFLLGFFKTFSFNPFFCKFYFTDTEQDLFRIQNYWLKAFAGIFKVKPLVQWRIILISNQNLYYFVVWSS